MSRAKARTRSASSRDPVVAARRNRETLPGAIDRAEIVGPSIIAQHLGETPHVARRIVASGKTGA